MAQSAHQPCDDQQVMQRFVLKFLWIVVCTYPRAFFAASICTPCASFPRCCSQMLDIRARMLLPVIVRREHSDIALAIFANPAEARSALQRSGPPFIMEPFTAKSKVFTKYTANELRPPRPRPETTAAVARRLIGHALDNKQLKKKASSRQERGLTAKHKARQEQRHGARASAWDD